jgi:5-methylcytosine-specific restriction endonuclease McrA
MYIKNLSLNGKKVVERDYKKEYEEYHSQPEQIKNRAMRNQARREMEKKGKVEKGDGKEVDHIKPLSKGGDNDKKNLRVVSRKTNRKKGDN